MDENVFISMDITKKIQVKKSTTVNLKKLQIHQCSSRIYRKLYIYRRIFTHASTGELYKLGERYKRPILANTLRRIAQNGADEFYKGETAAKMVQDLQREGGIITKEDLENYG